MSVGDSALLNSQSYLGIGQETALGAFNTLLAGLDFRSHSLKTQKDSKILEQVERIRTATKRIHLSKVTGGNIDWYFRPMETADCYLIKNAFGGAVISTSTVTGETTGGGGLDHVITLGYFNLTYSSLCINARWGASSTGKIKQFHGMRVDELTISAQIDEPLMCSVSMVGVDSTVVSSDVESQFTATSNPILSFVSGRLSIEGTFASLTTSSFWHIQNVSFKVKNNIKSGPEARRIGSDIPVVLPPGMQSYELSCQIRFNTTTAYDAMIAATEYGGELEFLGATISGSVAPQGLLIEFQKLIIKDAPFPEISGPDGVLTSQVTFDVLRDESATGYAVRATITNNITSF